MHMCARVRMFLHGNRAYMYTHLHTYMQEFHASILDMHAYIHTYLHKYIFIPLHINSSTHIHTHTHTHTQEFHVSIPDKHKVFIHPYTHIHTHIHRSCMCAYQTNIHTHTYTYRSYMCPYQTSWAKIRFTDKYMILCGAISTCLKLEKNWETGMYVYVCVCVYIYTYIYMRQIHDSTSSNQHVSKVREELRNSYVCVCMCVCIYTYTYI
jgi:hypothetical protein